MNIALPSFRASPSPARALALALLLAPLAAAETFTVDDSGGADFGDIGSAVASPAVRPGDTLLVFDGSYAGFVLERDLTLVAPLGETPFVLGTTRITSPGGATISGLDFQIVEVEGVAGKLLLHDVSVHDTPIGLPCVALRITDSANVHIDRSVLRGKDGDVSCESTALRVESSQVVLSGCTVQGGDGWGDTFEGFPGRSGIEVVGDSEVLVVASSVTGGDGGTPDVIFSGTGGNGASAISMPSPQALVTVRGGGQHELTGGLGGGGAFGGDPAFSTVTGSGTLVISGVSTDPPGFGFTLDVIEPEPPQALLLLNGSGAPGTVQTFRAVGPDGATFWLAGSLVPLQVTLPGTVDGTLHLNPGAAPILVPIETLGHGSTVVFDVTLPNAPGLLGVEAVFQGFVPGHGLTGGALATNTAHVVVR